MSTARILIVEDESIAALFVRKIVERVGYRVIDVMKSGEEAIEKASKEHPDLILMDIKLKGKKNGIETAQVIHDRYGIPSIFITAYSSEEFNEMYRFQGAFESLQKPIQEEVLLSRIERVLNM